MINHTIQFSPFSCSSLCFWSKYSPQNSVLKHRQFASDFCGNDCKEYRPLYYRRRWNQTVTHYTVLPSVSILVIKPTRCTNFSNLFWNRNLHASDSFSVHHQETSTVRTEIGICHTGCAVCTVLDSWWWTEKLSETCRVLFQNKFEKLVHLVGFMVKIYHDARSHGRQVHFSQKLCFLLIPNTSYKIYCLHSTNSYWEPKWQWLL